MDRKRRRRRVVLEKGIEGFDRIKELAGFGCRGFFGMARRFIAKRDFVCFGKREKEGKSLDGILICMT